MKRLAQGPRTALDLGAVQRWLQAEIMRADDNLVASHDGAPGPDPSPIRAESQVPPEHIVRSDARLSALTRVGVYREAYVRRLTECLADDYPALQFALGDGVFSDLCRDYIAAWPSSSPSLNFFGGHMAPFCRSRSGWPLGTFAADLAALEWALVEALHAQTLRALTLADLERFGGSAWAEAVFVPNPTVRIVSTEYPVNSFFHAFRQEQTPTLPSPKASATAIFRQDYTIGRKDLDAAEEVVLRALLSGTSVGASLGLAAGRSGEALEGNTVAGWFRSWFANGFFVAIKPSPN